MTVNAEPDAVDEPPTGRRDMLESRVGASRVPLAVSDGDLAGWGLASATRQIIDDQIRASLALRADGTTYRQIFNFHYRDGVRMVTVGGVLLDESMLDAFENGDWHSVAGYRDGVDPLKIELPSLTLRELAYLDRQLPVVDEALDCPGLKAAELKAYADYYRWYPRYALVDL